MRVIDNMADSTSFNAYNQTPLFVRDGIYYLFYTDDSDGNSLYMRQGKSVRELASATQQRVLDGMDRIEGKAYCVSYNTVVDIVGLAGYNKTTGICSFRYGSFDSVGEINWNIQHGTDAIARTFLGVGLDAAVAIGFTTSGRWLYHLTINAGAVNAFWACGRTHPTESAHWTNHGGDVAIGGEWEPATISGVGADSNNRGIICAEASATNEFYWYYWNGAVLGVRQALLNPDMEAPVGNSILLSDGNVRIACREEGPGFKQDVYIYTYDESANTFSNQEIVTLPNTTLTPRQVVALAKDDDNDNMYLVFNEKNAGGTVQYIRFYKYQNGVWNNLTDRLSTLDISDPYTEITSIAIVESGRAAAGGSNTVVAWTNIADGRNELWMTEIRDLLVSFTATPRKGNAPLRVKFTDTSQSIDTEI